MSRFSASPWMSRLATLCLAGLAAASAVAWALKIQGLRTTDAVAEVAPTTISGLDTALVAKALGANARVATPEAPTVLATSRFVLVGVVAAGARGAALLAVDGKPAKPFAVGSKVVDDYVLTSVQARKAVLSNDVAGELVLALPAVLDKNSL